MAEWKVASSIKGLFPVPGPVPAPASEVQPPTPASSPAPVSSFPNKALFSFVDKVEGPLSKPIGASVQNKQSAAKSLLKRNGLWFGVGGAAVACIVLVLFLLVAGRLQQSDQELSSFTNSIGIKLMRIPTGKFLMGSSETEEKRHKSESQHEVIINQNFYMGSTEVTQAQWQKVMRNNPSKFQGDQLPVEQISWDEAIEFCKRLSEMPQEKKAGRKYRLPTEAEWEYACRAGTTTPFHFGSQLNGKQANCNGTKPFGTDIKGPFLEKTSSAGKYPANGWGLHDMHGNVYEWCSDWDGDYSADSVTAPSGPATGSSRVYRGGGWHRTAVNCRSASRGGSAPSFRNGDLGFRVALSLSENSK